MRDSLPDSPYWRGTRFRGTATSATEVCVNRTVKEAIGGAGRTSHVVVSWPDLTLGEPQDGPCAKAAENADRAIRRAHQFYFRMDNAAIALDDAISAAQDGQPGAARRLSQLRRTIRDRLNAYLLAGGDLSVGGNLLLSSATTAVEAAEVADIGRLARVRRDIAEARQRLVEEATD